jgi:hypothetical protein
MTDPRTQHKRPIPARPQWGWFAWEATVGYIHQEYSPDALLTIQMYPSDGVVLWGAVLSWADIQEGIRDRFGFAPVLADLWWEVSRHHRLFKTLEAASRSPQGYGDDEWVDVQTLDVLTRMVGATATIFEGDWSLMVTYRALEKPTDRVQARLLAQNNTVVRGGRGATLRDACRNLYHNALPDFKQHKKNP